MRICRNGKIDPNHIRRDPFQGCSNWEKLADVRQLPEKGAENLLSGQSGVFCFPGLGRVNNWCLEFEHAPIPYLSDLRGLVFRRLVIPVLEVLVYSSLLRNL